jgi:hypothetical protein
MPHRTDAMGKTLSGVIPGSRLLPTDRASNTRSGSPPGTRGFATVLAGSNARTPATFLEDDDDDYDKPWTALAPSSGFLRPLPVSKNSTDPLHSGEHVIDRVAASSYQLCPDDFRDEITR